IFFSSINNDRLTAPVVQRSGPLACLGLWRSFLSNSFRTATRLPRLRCFAMDITSFEWLWQRFLIAGGAYAGWIAIGAWSKSTKISVGDLPGSQRYSRTPH